MIEDIDENEKPHKTTDCSLKTVSTCNQGHKGLSENEIELFKSIKKSYYKLIDDLISVCIQQDNFSGQTNEGTTIQLGTDQRMKEADKT